MATIIKRDSAMALSGTDVRGVAYQFADIEGKADDYLANVRQAAAQIVHQARDEAVAIRQHAEAAGRQAAQEAVEKMLDERVAKRMATLTPALEEVVRQVADAKQLWLQHWDAAAVKLAAAIAERLVRRELNQQPEISLEWMHEALHLAAGSGETTLRIHPEDEKTLHKQIDELQAVFAPISKVRVVADPSISPGGCRADTQFGCVDQQLETQLQRVRDELN